MNEDVNLWDLELTNDEHEPKRTKIVDNKKNPDSTFDKLQNKNTVAISSIVNEKIINSDKSQISVKATTTDHLGFIGNGSGISANSIVKKLFH